MGVLNTTEETLELVIDKFIHILEIFIRKKVNFT